MGNIKDTLFIFCPRGGGGGGGDKQLTNRQKLSHEMDITKNYNTKIQGGIQLVHWTTL